MEKIAPRVCWMSRREWGASRAYPRLGFPVSRLDRTEAIHHHTVGVDDDSTPNLWETLDEIKAKMRYLQTARPDLGLDVPYNIVAFFMADGRLILCEGRGLDLTGAHTAYQNALGQWHNVVGVAIAIYANLEHSINMEPWITPLSHAWGWLKFNMGMTNLGRLSPPAGVTHNPLPSGDVYGHRAFEYTACPGQKLWDVIQRIGFLQPPHEGVELSSQEFKELSERADEQDEASEKAHEQITRVVGLLHKGQGDDILDLVHTTKLLRSAIDFLAKVAVNHEERIKTIEAGGTTDVADVSSEAEANRVAIDSAKESLTAVTERVDAIAARLKAAGEELVGGSDDAPA